VRCEPGWHCEGGGCVRDPCGSQADCPAGQFCVNGICQGQQCFSDPDCPSGQWCIMGFCVQACLDDSYCPENYRCDNFFCVYDPCADVYCPPGMECQDGQCVQPRECYNDWDCPPGLHCTPQGQCVGGADGQQGDFCDPTTGGCAEGLDCLLFGDQYMHGFCADQCDCSGGGSGCPAPSICLWTDQSTCWCGYTCYSNDPFQDCPNGGAGWHCEAISGVSVCMPD